MTKMTALFAELAEIDKKMAVTNHTLSVRQLTAMDDRHSAIWSEIIAYQPANRELAELMVLMLLDKMQVMAARGENCMIVREKILELFSLNANQPDQYMRILEPRVEGTAMV